MYRTADPRFRRRLNEIENTLERANESAQSSIYIFGQNYIKPCFEAISLCLTSCLDASCPCLEPQRNRPRRQRGRSRASSRPELNFDFYDDWDIEESDALLGWEDDNHEQPGDSSGTYGAISAQPSRHKSMQYPRLGRGNTATPLEGGADAGLSRRSSFFSRFFGAKSVTYTPSTAGLQEHPGGSRRYRRKDDLSTEFTSAFPGIVKNVKQAHGRKRSGTASSGHTTDSYSSRGDIFPSDDEDDAVPLDDEFAMVLERRNTQTGDNSGNETEVHPSNALDTPAQLRRSKRPAVGRARSGRQTTSSRSIQSSDGGSSRRSSQRAISQHDGLMTRRRGSTISTDLGIELKGSTIDEGSHRVKSSQNLAKQDMQPFLIVREAIDDESLRVHDDDKTNASETTDADELRPNQRLTPLATTQGLEEDPGQAVKRPRKETDTISHDERLS